MIQNFIKKMKSKKGFTLIELIVVIAILGILALIAIPKLNGVQEDARKTSDIANGKAIANVVSAGVARGKISTSVSAKTVLPTDAADEIKKGFPNGYPTGQTTAVKGSDFYYTVDVSTGSVELFLKKDSTYYEVFPTPDAIFK